MIEIDKFINADHPFFHGFAPAFEKLNDAPAGDAGQNGPRELGSHKFAVDFKHDVAGAHFLDMAAGGAVKPQGFFIAGFVGLFGGRQGSGVIAAAFGFAGPADDGAGVDAFNVHHRGFKTVFIIGPHGTENDKELVGFADAHADIRIRRENKGTNIQRRARSRRDPVLFKLNQLF